MKQLSVITDKSILQRRDKKEYVSIYAVSNKTFTSDAFTFAYLFGNTNNWWGPCENNWFYVYLVRKKEAIYDM